MVADSLPDCVVVFVAFEANTANRFLIFVFECKDSRQAGLLLATRVICCFGGCSRAAIFTYQCLWRYCYFGFALLAGDKSGIGDLGGCELNFRGGEEAFLDGLDGRRRSVAVANSTKAHDLGGIQITSGRSSLRCGLWGICISAPATKIATSCTAEGATLAMSCAGLENRSCQFAE
jgi:hypothetical protein